MAQTFVSGFGADNVVSPSNTAYGHTGLSNKDLVLLFPCYGSFAFAAIAFPTGAEPHVWAPYSVQSSPFNGGPYILWTTYPIWAERFSGETGNLSFAGNSTPFMFASVAYRGWPVFTTDDMVAEDRTNVSSGLLVPGASGSITAGPGPNYCTGGTNVALWVFTGTPKNCDVAWPSGVTEVFRHRHATDGLIAIAEERITGDDDWPYRTFGWSTGDQVYSGFGGIGIQRVRPLFRQDGVLT